MKSKYRTDILAIGVHPDDIEMGCAGTLLHMQSKGALIGMLDLTKGELGTKGNAIIRHEEAMEAKDVLGIEERHNVGLKDGFLQQTEEELMEIIRYIRHFNPRIVLANAIDDRHPDHGRAAQIVSEACFYAGLAKIETIGLDGKPQKACRPESIYHYIQDYYIKPDFIVDITPYMDQKMQAILCFASQFYTEGKTEPLTPISNPSFLEEFKAKARIYGRLIGRTYGEGFTTKRPLGMDNLMDLY